MLKTRLLVLFLLVFLPINCCGAYIHGSIYDWESFDLAKNVIVDINSVPKQTFVSKEGIYSFEVAPGSYLIRAVLTEDGLVKLNAEENIQIVDDSSYIVDLVLFPPLEDDMSILDYLGMDTDLDIEAFSDLGDEEGVFDGLIFLIFFIVAALILIVYFYFRKFKVSGKPEEKIADTKVEKPIIDEKSLEVLNIIKNAGGRMTQKDLRDRVSFSEAQVSLILTELESMGRIKKIKKGRGNIIRILE